jgi:ribosomal protein L37AE/L43A
VAHHVRQGHELGVAARHGLAGGGERPGGERVENVRGRPWKRTAATVAAAKRELAELEDARRRSEQRTQARLAAVPRCPYCHGAREPFGRAWRCVACETTFDQIGIQPAPLPAKGPQVIAFFLAPR